MQNTSIKELLKSMALGIERSQHFLIPIIRVKPSTGDAVPQIQRVHRVQSPYERSTHGMEEEKIEEATESVQQTT